MSLKGVVSHGVCFAVVWKTQPKGCPARPWFIDSLGSLVIPNYIAALGNAAEGMLSLSLVHVQLSDPPGPIFIKVERWATRQA